MSDDAMTALGLCLRLAQIDDGDALKFEGEVEFLHEMVAFFMKADPKGTRALAKRLRKEQAAGAASDDTCIKYTCIACKDTGWVRSIPNDHASARMTCKCRRRFGSTVEGGL